MFLLKKMMHLRLFLLVPSLVFYFFSSHTVLLAQGQDTPDTATPANKEVLMAKLAALPCGIGLADSKATVLTKIAEYLDGFEPNAKYPDDVQALASVKWALKGVQTGGYGIGAVIAHENDGILHGAYNAQIQKKRSDLHGEMHLLTEFESKKKFRKYLNSWEFTGEQSPYASSLTVYSSAEPCPMCFVRLSIAGVKTKYVTTGPDDGMTNRADCLPPFWAELARKNAVQKANANPILEAIAHALFFSFLL